MNVIRVVLMYPTSSVEQNLSPYCVAHVSPGKRLVSYVSAEASSGAPEARVRPSPLSEVSGGSRCPPANGAPVPPLRWATSSASIDRAVSAAVRAPRFRPTGEDKRSNCASVTTSARSWAERSTWVCLIPSPRCTRRALATGTGILSLGSRVRTQMVVEASTRVRRTNSCGQHRTTCSAPGNRSATAKTGRAPGVAHRHSLNKLRPDRGVDHGGVRSRTPRRR